MVILGVDVLLMPNELIERRTLLYGCALHKHDALSILLYRQRFLFVLLRFEQVNQSVVVPAPNVTKKQWGKAWDAYNSTM